MQNTNFQGVASPIQDETRQNTMASGADGIITSQSMILERMPQQPALLGSIDDWTGVTKAGDRRKIQNRLNQRLYSESSLDLSVCGLIESSRKAKADW